METLRQSPGNDSPDIFSPKNMVQDQNIRKTSFTSQNSPQMPSKSQKASLFSFGRNTKYARQNSDLGVDDPYLNTLGQKQPSENDLERKASLISL